jgi:quinoprotein glucose dehydrogenase
MTSHRGTLTSLALLTVVGALVPIGCAPRLEPLAREQRSTEWRSYGGSLANARYSPLDQVNAGNVRQLRIAWRWTSPDDEIVARNPTIEPGTNEATPLMVGGILYVSTALSQVAAIDAITGRTLWVHDPKIYEAGRPANLGFVHRGVAYWSDGTAARILIGTGNAYLIALDAKTGEPIPTFGTRGRVDLTEGLGRTVERRLYSVTSPPVIVRDVVIVGSSIHDWPSRKDLPPGDVRGFDVRTGAQRWTFRTIPRDGEYGSETWEQESWKHTGGANVWSVMSADEDLGYVYLPVSTPANDYYGGHRPGDNLFAESLVCLDARTGTRVWHYQMAHHGVWDYDVPAAPNLVDITVKGQPIKAVAQVTKQGFAFVFDRVTGRPVWPIEERPVPASRVPGETTSPTQPFPTRPLPFERQGLTADDVIDFTPELRRQALGILDRYDHGPLFTPPSERGTVLLPGPAGGASWSGAAFDPEHGRLFVPSITWPLVVTLFEPVPRASPDRYAGMARLLGGPAGLPITKPPYGRITAIDLGTGEHAWTIPLGDGPRRHPVLEALDLPRLGWDRRGFVLATRTLLLAGQQGPATGVRPAQLRRDAFTVTYATADPKLSAFDKATGALLAEIDLPANVHGSPMTYLAGGKQFIVVPVGGADIPAELVALALP